MSANDPIAGLLAELDGPAAPGPEFAEKLMTALLAELHAPAPGRGTRAARPSRRWTGLRLAVLLAALILVLASVATATYVVVHDGGGDAVTVLQSHDDGDAFITGIGPDGRTRAIWHCPRYRFCGDLVSAAWAPDGRHLAISLTQIGGLSLYPGVHIIDTETGHDRKIVGFSDDLSGRSVSQQEFGRFLPGLRTMVRTYGCVAPEQLAWSPDASKIAYTCGSVRNQYLTSAVYVMNADGTHPRKLRTGTSAAAWPSWSPAGDRIVFSTAMTPRQHVRTNTGQPDRVVHSSIYTIDLQGGHRRRIATGAAPAWSPTGAAIAYVSACGRVRLVTPGAHDLTPGDEPGRCVGIGPKGVPEWSPDGTAIAIGTGRRIYVIDADGTNLREIGTSVYGGITGNVRPSWQPRPVAAQSPG